MLSKSLCGEMTIKIKSDISSDIDTVAEEEMVNAVVTAMNLTSKVEVAELKEVLFPCLMCSAAYKNNFSIIETCFKECANISAGEGNTVPNKIIFLLNSFLLCKKLIK